MKRQSVQLLVADEDKTCSCCGGTIPKGHKYWQTNYGHHGAEHTNCELYTPSYNHRRRPSSYDTAV